jgi:hypothetical protein
MLEQGKTWNAIMKKVQVGPGTIKKVQDGIMRSKAFEMFAKNCSLHEVALKLDLSSANVKKYQLEYLELQGQHELVRLLSDKEISNLVLIAREIKIRDLTVQQLETALKLSISTSHLEHTYRELSDHIRIESKKYAKLCEERSTTEAELEKLSKHKDRLLENTGILEARLMVYRRALGNMCNSKELTNVQQIVDNTTRSILEDKKILFCAAAVAIIRAISTEPHSITLFSDPTATEKLASFFLDPGPPGNEIWIYQVAKSIFENYVYFLAKGIVGCTINTLGDSKYETLTDQMSAEIGQLMTLHKHSPFLRTLFRN